MKPIPSLNLNKHPYEVQNGALIDATNIIISNDNAVIQSENKLNNTNLYYYINGAINNADLNLSLNEILYIIPCSRELILFCKLSDDTIRLFRYNEDDVNYNDDEDYVPCEYCTQIEYSGGEFVGTFTYNNRNLIIAFSEYGDDLNIPLRTINLGEYKKDLAEIDKKQLEDTNFHPICIELKYPVGINYELKYGNAHKGIYYVFIRYKIGNNDYTQWINTNLHILLDNYNQEDIFSYWIGKNYPSGVNIPNNGNSEGAIGTLDISNDTEFTSRTFKINVTNTNYINIYKYYQLGFICVRKDTTLAYRSNDINVNTTTFEFDRNNVIEYSAQELIKTYYNYYNVRSLTNCRNRLYIGNYKEYDEKNLLTFIKQFNITLKINKVQCNLNRNIYKVNNDGDTFQGSYTIEADGKSRTIDTVDVIVKNGYYLLPLTNSFWIRNNTSELEDKFEEISIGSNTNATLDVYFNGKSHSKNIIGGSYYFAVPINGGNIDIVRYQITDAEPESILNDDTDGNYYDYYDGSYDNAHVNITKINQSDTNYTIYFETISLTITNSTTKINSDIDEQTENNQQAQTYSQTIDITTFIPGEYYNFFVHFVDKYGYVTKGYNIGLFNSITLDGTAKTHKFLNYIGDTLINIEYDNPHDSRTYNSNNNYIDLLNTFQINFELGYNGTIDIQDFVYFFISMEKFEKCTKLSGLCQFDTALKKGKFFANELNYADEINIDIDEFYTTPAQKVSKSSEYLNNQRVLNSVYKRQDNIINENNGTITSKELIIADTYNNILQQTFVNFQYNISNTQHLNNKDLMIGRFIKTVKIDNNTISGENNTKTDDDYRINMYLNSSKTLIPCSIYQMLDPTMSSFPNVQLIPNAYVTLCSAFKTINIFEQSVLYNDAIKVFQRINNSDNNLNISDYPFDIISWYDYKEVPEETIQINNKPDVTFFPTSGYNTEESYDKNFKVGTIFEIKNTTDLFQQKNMSVSESCPKTYTNYDSNLQYVYNFPKNIRRSNIIQDESNSNVWRQFEIEQYKVINENKGDVIKLISIGYYFIVHTQGSMFLFNSTNSIKSNEEQNIQLSNVDIWDIDYKEVLTSQLGYAGIQEEYSGLVGNFGYVFYDREAKRIYKYDNNQIEYIDNDITNFVKKLSNDIKCNIVEDVQRNRLLFRFYNDDNNYILSYNYRTGTFVSRHEYGTNNYYRGFSTKENIYLISSDKKNIFQFNELQYNNCDIHIMFNANYQFIKYIEYLIYRLCRISTTSVINYSPVEGMNYYYAGSELRVYTDLTDTGLIDVSNDNNTNVNTIGNYKQPYWKLGNWHFNTLRNKLKDYFDNNNIAENMSRIYGNWFVIEFKFNINDNPNDKIEIENVDVQLINGESI